MTLNYGEEKPSLEELAHYGVLGMKWGQRKKATGREIRSARRRLSTKQNELFDKQDQVKTLAKGSTARSKGEKELGKMTTDFLKNPDRVTATRLTRGEKAAFLIISAPSGGLGGLAAIATSSAISRRIEKKQDDKAYDKKR
jgi:hypothetical protein